jgi:hypothetical protein
MTPARVRIAAFAALAALFTPFIAHAEPPEGDAPRKAPLGLPETVEPEPPAPVGPFGALETLWKEATTRHEVVARAVCRGGGSKGTVIECPIRLTADRDGITAKALQGTLLYDASVASFQGFYDELCPTPENCFTKQLTDTQPGLGKTGHTMAFAPRDPEEWKGKGTFLLAHLSSPTTALSDARTDVAAGGEGLFVARFMLDRDVPEWQPFFVELVDVVVADEAASEVAARVERGSIVTGKVIEREPRRQRGAGAQPARPAERAER